MTRSHKPDEPLAAPATAEPAVDTTHRQNADLSDASTLPKLPHEQDQSVDMTHGKPDEQMEQAYLDVQRGLQDTDEELRAHSVGKPTAPSKQKK